MVFMGIHGPVGAPWFYVGSVVVWFYSSMGFHEGSMVLLGFMKSSCFYGGFMILSGLHGSGGFMMIWVSLLGCTTISNMRISFKEELQ